MIVTVCIGSSCHIKGSRLVVETLQEMISQYELDDKVELRGAFCMNKCQSGICVTIDDELFSVTPDNVKNFFEENIKSKL